MLHIHPITPATRIHNTVATIHINDKGHCRGMMKEEAVDEVVNARVSTKVSTAVAKDSAGK